MDIADLYRLPRSTRVTVVRFVGEYAEDVARGVYVGDTDEVMAKHFTGAVAVECGIWELDHPDWPGERVEAHVDSMMLTP